MFLEWRTGVYAISDEQPVVIDDFSSQYYNYIRRNFVKSLTEEGRIKWTFDEAKISKAEWQFNRVGILKDIDLLNAQQQITELDINNIESEQRLTDLDIRLLELELGGTK